jgi:hypothetical protein
MYKAWSLGFSLLNLASWPYGSLALAKKYLCEKKKYSKNKIKPLNLAWTFYTPFMEFNQGRLKQINSATDS